MNILQNLELALRKNELKKFLEGKNEYKIINRDTGTNDNLRALVDGIYKYYKLYPQINLDKLFESTLIQMMNGDEFDILTAFDYLRLQIISEVRNNAPFELKKQIYIEMKNSILKNHDKLEKYTSEEYTSNPLTYIEMMNEYMGEKYDRKVL